MAILVVKPGDVIPIPARLNGVAGFVLCRVVATKAANVVEVFSGFRTDYESIGESFESAGCSIEDRMFPPVLTAFHFSKFTGRVRWLILGSLGNSDEWNAREKLVEFREHDYDRSGRFFRGDVRCQEIGLVRRPLEDLTIYSNVQLIFRINLHLAGVLAHGEAFPPQRMARLIAEHGADWLEGEYESCKQLSDEVATRFKEVHVARRRAHRSGKSIAVTHDQ